MRCHQNRGWPFNDFRTLVLDCSKNKFKVGKFINKNETRRSAM